eukprot:m.149445 g.149445  ORF g.149445 m.149445 type:complete len:198 (-) comp16295_c0_seq1:2452-3045(-)
MDSAPPGMIASKRLLFQPLEAITGAADVDQRCRSVAKMLSDERAVLHLPSLRQTSGWSLEQARSRFAQRQAAQLEGKARNFDVYLQDTNDFVGIAGYRQLTTSETCKVGEFGLIVQGDHHRKGLGYEIAETLLTHGFSSLGLDSVFLITDRANKGMCALSDKLGMTEDTTIALPAAMTDPIAYSITKMAWAARAEAV